MNRDYTTAFMFETLMSKLDELSKKLDDVSSNVIDVETEVHKLVNLKNSANVYTRYRQEIDDINPNRENER